MNLRHSKTGKEKKNENGDRMRTRRRTKQRERETASETASEREDWMGIAKAKEGRVVCGRVTGERHE